MKLLKYSERYKDGNEDGEGAVRSVPMGCEDEEEQPLSSESLMVQLKIIALPAALFFMLTAFFTGCAAVGPDYKPARIDAGDSWKSAEAAGIIRKTPSPSELAEWWNRLNDPLLAELVRDATSGNLDLKEALSRVREARAQRVSAQLEKEPTIDGSASVSRSRSSDSTGGGFVTSRYSAGFDAGWELDIFGGTRRSIEASDANLQMSVADYNATLVSLAAEVAINYIDLRTYQRRISIARENLQAQMETFDLVKAQYTAGISSELDVQQARYNLESTRSTIPVMKTSLEAAMNRIAVLLGRRPGELHDRLRIEGKIPEASDAIAVGVPADTLRNRPDIRMAEREVAMRTAEIGVAVADLYPKFSLSGSIGLDALSGGDMLHSGSGSWSVTPGISWRVFDRESIRKNIEIKTEEQEQALIKYQSAVLSALEEVENSLTSYGNELEHRKNLTNGMNAAKVAVKLARDQYFSGLVDFSDVLDSQRSLLSFEDQLAQSNGSIASDIVTIYKVMGGGWTNGNGESLKDNKSAEAELIK